jgi:hypothetical protein
LAIEVSIIVVVVVAKKINWKLVAAIAAANYYLWVQSLSKLFEVGVWKVATAFMVGVVVDFGVMLMVVE